MKSVCHCPERVDTWAGLALARARSITRRLDQVRERETEGGVGMSADTFGCIDRWTDRQTDRQTSR